MSDKTNIYHLRVVMGELKKDCLNEQKMEEAFEFLNATEDDFKDAMKDKMVKEDAEPDVDLDDIVWRSDLNEDFVGLDTIWWKLEKGNLVIQDKVEQFITMLKRQNGAAL